MLINNGVETALEPREAEVTGRRRAGAKFRSVLRMDALTMRDTE